MRLALLLCAGLSVTACSLTTDAATRLAQDVVDGAVSLQASGDEERTVEHRPRSWPAGCSGAWTVTFQESLHHPQSGGSLLIGCKGTPNFARLGYTYGTTSHLHAVRVPSTLSIEKDRDAVLRVTLRKSAGTIEVAAIQ
ncbi:MAG TPA: hypothetical protein VFC25_13490 [Verrucomicrobiae bacterium]|nr:hypothetical protein [Verrucomicrobiae bacterium]